MEKLKRTVSAVMALMVAFVGLAAATTVVEPPDVSNYKSGAYTITCADYGYAVDYQADISPGSDADWFKCSVYSGDKIGQFLEANAYTNYVGMYAEDQNGNFVERLSYRFGSAGTGIVNAPPLYSKVVNDYAGTYYGYQFFINRNMP